MSGVSSISRANIDYVSYRAGNRLLIIANAKQVSTILDHLSDRFQVCCLLAGDTDITTHQRLLVSGVEILPEFVNPTLQGFLGHFKLTGLDEYLFDQVVDFQEQPAINSIVAPIGYYSIKRDPANPASIAQRLSEMVGQFDKPRFFKQQLQLCAHSQRGIQGCRQCLDVCATDAISSESGEIRIDPYLCQGCGDCASVCPAGAINYQYPDASETLSHIKKLFTQDKAILMLHTGLQEKDFSWYPEPIKMLQLEALGSVGMDIWLCALAYGANQVWLLDNQSLTENTRQLLIAQIEQARTILRNVGYDDNLIQLASVPEFVPMKMKSKISPATFLPNADKRTLIRMAIEHLVGQIGSIVESFPLPDPASFGNIIVNQEGCTLCMACVSVCPEQAFSSGFDRPQLKFIEASCVQCGICSQACPEQVITLQSRYLVDSVAARKPRLLNEEKPFNCVNCEKPFATQSMINNMLEKLQHHPMFLGEKKKLLMMCEQCKVSVTIKEKQ